MADIKTKDNAKGTIRTIDKAAVATQRMKQAYIATKEKAERSVNANSSSAEEYASDKLESGIDEVVHDGAYAFDKAGRKGLETTKENIRTAKDGIQRFKQQRAEQSLRKQASHNTSSAIKTVDKAEKTIKQSATSSGKKTIKFAGKEATKTAQKSVKTAEQTAKTAIKTSQQAAKAAQKTAQATVKASQKAAQAAKKYTISKTTKPCSSAYIRGKGYNAKSKNYFTIKSYLEKLKKQGGGTLVLKKGTYKICSTLTVPSNITIQLKNGVVLKKTDKTGSKSLKAGKVMFKLTSAKAKDYKGTKKVVITSNKKATIDLGKVKNAVAIDMGHNYNVSISNLKFRNKNAGTYINIAGSRTVKVTNCTFQGNAAYTGGSYQAAVLINAYGRTPCKTVKVTGNTFTNLENGIRTTKYKKQVYSEGVSIQNNKFKNMTVSAVTGKMWTGAAITGNTIYRSDASKGTAFAFQLYSMTEPEISKNKIDKCRTPIYFGRASKIDNSISEAKISSMENNTVTDAVVYYVIQKHDSETRLLYFKDKNDKDFRITTETTPYRGHYETASGYTANSGQAKTYYVFRSYMEQLEYTGGGTITVAAGTYTLSHSVCIPSNVTVNFEDGVKIQKVKAVNTNLATNKTMFELVPPSKEGVKNSVGGYNGSQNVTLQGNGSTIYG